MNVQQAHHQAKVTDKQAVDLTVDYVATDGTREEVGLILAHGAGGDKDSGNLPAFANKLAEAGFPCVRFTCKPINLPIRVAAYKAVIQAACSWPETSHISRWVCAGHSMGGRAASQVAHDFSTSSNDSSTSVLGCIFFSYPLHPPGKPDELRDHPLTDLTVPVLFVRGSEDDFSTEHRFSMVTKQMASDGVEVHTVEGGDHGLKLKGRKQAGQQEATIQAICDAAVRFLQTLATEQHAVKQHTRTGPSKAKDEGSHPVTKSRKSTAAADKHKKQPTADKVQTKKQKQPPKSAGKGKAASAAASAKRSPGVAASTKKAPGSKTVQAAAQTKSRSASPHNRKQPSTKSRKEAAVSKKRTAQTRDGPNAVEVAGKGARKRQKT